MPAVPLLFFFRIWSEQTLRASGVLHTVALAKRELDGLRNTALQNACV